MAVTYHGGKTRLYVDGRLRQETAVTSPGEFEGVLLFDGTDRHHGAYWSGSIDEAVVFGRALSEEEMAELAEVDEPWDE